MITPEQYEQIEAYLFNQMKDTEKAAFEAELSRNEELASELAYQRLEHHAMRLNLDDDLKTQMQSWKQELQENQGNTEASSPKIVPIRRLNLRILAIAASVLVILGFFGQYLINTNYGSAAISGDKDFMVTILRGARSSDLSLLQEANTALSSKQYQQVFFYLDQIDTSTYDTELLRAGAAYGLKDYAACAKYLQSAQKGADDNIKQELDWKLVMLYISTHQDEQAKSLLESIAQDTYHDYQEDAQKVLTKMQSFWRRLAW